MLETMLDTMLDLSYAFIFVAGAAGLAVIAILGTTRTMASDARRSGGSGIWSQHWLGRRTNVPAVRDHG